MAASSNPLGIRLPIALCLSLAALAGQAQPVVPPAASVPPVPALAEPLSSDQPEASSGRERKPVVRAREFLAVTAHPLASEAAFAMLAEGASAVDAAIAAQAVLALVEPQSSGVGGGGFLLHHDPRTGTVQAYDGRETAPAAARADRFIDTAGRPLGFAAAVIGGRSVGVPGLFRMLELAHRDHGVLPWAKLFEPAIRHAREGFDLSPRLHALLTRDRWLRDDTDARSLFYDTGGQALPVGTRLRHPALADTLATIAAHGAEALHQGPIARDLVARVRGHATNPGDLTEDDLSRYRALRRTPLCTPHRDWLVCGMPPPSAGAISVAQILAIGEHAARRGAIAELAPATNTIAAHLFTEAGRLAFADRDRWIADPAFARVPVRALLDSRYLSARAALIGQTSMDTARPGDPERFLAESRARHALEGEVESTTHLSIIDRAGRTVALTSSIEQAFGSRLMVRGFLLNNQLTDFSFMAQTSDGPHPNRVEGGKRPRSSMAPTLVFGPNTLVTAQPGAARQATDIEPAPPLDPENAPPITVGNRPMVLAVGSPGGPSIINYVARTLMGVLNDGLPLQQVIDAPNLGSRNGPTELEAGSASRALADALVARAHRISLTPMTSGLHGIARRCAQSGEDCVLESGTDPRREGLARGR
ncbi:MAG: gamma-glutamyltransferase family protein [Betaproteobacteria bacterium]|nr:gamma-glutamyltransferase family protein [Betaproteobacteria bacterium]